MEGVTAMDNAAGRYDLITALSRLEGLEAQRVGRPRMDRLRRFVEACAYWRKRMILIA